MLLEVVLLPSEAIFAIRGGNGFRDVTRSEALTTLYGAQRATHILQSVGGFLSLRVWCTAVFHFLGAQPRFGDKAHRI